MAHVLYRIACLLQRLEHPLDIRQEHISGVGQAHTAPAPLEQLLPQLPLQRLDPRRNRWLRQLEHLRRSAERAVDSDLYEGFDLTEIQGMDSRAIDCAYRRYAKE